MTRVPLLSGTRIAVVEVPDGGVVLRPPPPVDVLGSVASATREALRFPLAGDPLEQLVTPGGTATVVIELPNLPVPSATPDPRQEAIAATVDELERLGVARITILVACGLFRRPSPREIGLLVPPEFRRRDIERALPGVSTATIRLVLNELRDTGQIALQGSGPGARWQRRP